jgi:hypothetical protein
MNNPLKLLQQALPVLSRGKDPAEWKMAQEIERYLKEYESIPVRWGRSRSGWVTTRRYGAVIFVIPPNPGSSQFLWAVRYKTSVVEGISISEEDAKQKALIAAKDMFDGKR